MLERITSLADWAYKVSKEPELYEKIAIEASCLMWGVKVNIERVRKRFQGHTDYYKNCNTIVENLNKAIRNIENLSVDNNEPPPPDVRDEYGAFLNCNCPSCIVLRESRIRDAVS